MQLETGLSAESRRPTRTSSRAKWRKTLTPYGFLLPYLIAFMVFQILPFFSGIALSFMRWQLLERTRSFIGMQNFAEVIADDLFWRSLWNSTYFATLTTLGIAVVSLSAALALKHVTRGQTFFRVVLYVPVILSISVIGIVWSRVISNDGLFNYYITRIGIPRISFLGEAALVIPSLSAVTVWWGFGFPMLIFLAALYAIPESLYEAAKLDGAGSWGLFRYVTVPLLRFALLLVLVTQFISHMQVFGQAYTLTSGGPGYASYPIIMYIYQTAWRYYHMGYASAMAVLLGLFMLVVVLVQIRLLGKQAEY